MHRGLWLALFSLAVLAGAAQNTCAKEETVSLWAADPLVKVFRDAEPPPRLEKAHADVARGEYASLQIVLRAGIPLEKLSAEAPPMTRRGGKETLQPRMPRWVGYVNVDRPSQTPSKDQLREPPFDYPDPLLEDPVSSLPANQAQPLWITVPIPSDAHPGHYRGNVLISWTEGDGSKSQAFPISIRVYPAQIKDTRLWVTEWFSMQWRHLDLDIEPESDAYYALLGRYARNMADHRHNVALISPLGLAEYSAKDGQLAIDFSRFDRWVRVFQEAGVIGRIEGGHIGGRKEGWVSPFVVRIREITDGKVTSRSVEPDSPEADRFYAQFFPALVAHLKEMGWLECYMQHLADEPIPGNIESYRAMAALARKYAPELRIVEACHTKDLAGSMDIWVPQLNYLEQDYAYYQERQSQGEEVWFYTCVFPQGEYANRFLEQPLMKTRLLHWINYRYGATGYLHWGYNQWTEDDPYTHSTRPHGGPPYLPAGDPWIVYPGKEGPLDSIRFEAMRDGITDHELLSQLGEKNPKAAVGLAEKHILAFDQYNTDIEQFRKTRKALLKKLGGK